MESQHEFLAEAQALLGPRGFTTDADLVTPWLTDWRGRFTGRALGLASPASRDEVVTLVNPARPADIVGQVTLASAADVEAALSAAARMRAASYREAQVMPLYEGLYRRAQRARASSPAA